MAEKQETIGDIIAEIRKSDCDEICPWWADGGSCVHCPLGGSGENCSFSIYADRLEAAHKREKSAIEADALAVGGMVEAARTTTEKSSAVGDCAKLREALKKVAESSAEIMERVRYKDRLAFNIANYIAGVARTALAEPPRNCDVGTAEEQVKRHKKWCDSDGNICMFSSCRVCFANWAQMPYEEGGDS